MSIIQNKKFSISFLVIFSIFIISLIVNFTSVGGNKIQAIKTNKIFSINTTFNPEKKQFLLSSENNIDFVKNINKFTHNISYIIFNINADGGDQSEIAHLFDLPDNVTLAFATFNNDIIQKTKYFGHQFLLKLNFYNEDKRDNNQLWINASDTNENIENKILETKKFLETHGTSVYIEDIDVSKIENNQFLIDKLLELNPFITTKQNTCNEKTKICFIKNDNEDLNIKFQEIFTKYMDNNEKWFVALEYNGGKISDIETALSNNNNKFLDIENNVLKTLRDKQ